MASRTRTVQVKRSRLKQQADFLSALAECVSIIRSCKKSKVPRQNIYDWLKSDEKFKKLYDEVLQLALGALEDEAIRRAHEGVLKPVYQAGKKVGKIREYSDTLLRILLQARAPEKYTQRLQNEISGPGGKPLAVDNTVTHVHSNVPIAENEEDVV